MDTIETLQFTQKEIRLIQIAFDNLVTKGGLRLGDIMSIYPILEKLEEKKKPLKEDTQNSVEEKPQQ